MEGDRIQQGDTALLETERKGQQALYFKLPYKGEIGIHRIGVKRMEKTSEKAFDEWYKETEL